METPEVHAPHARRTRRGRRHEGLPRWLELTIAITALVTSISSIVIAIQHGHMMEKLVEANSIPYLQGGFSDTTLEGDQVLSLDLLNRGVGPAHERSLHVKVGDRYVGSARDLVLASVGPETYAKAQPFLGHLIKNRVRTRFIPGGQSQTVLRFVRTPDNASFWDQLANSQDRWDVEFCYCSVFEECWQVRGKWSEPQHIKECRRDEGNEFFP